MQTKQFHVIPNTLFPCLPTPSPTSRPLHDSAQQIQTKISEIKYLKNNFQYLYFQIVSWAVFKKKNQK